MWWVRAIDCDVTAHDTGHTHRTCETYGDPTGTEAGSGSAATGSGPGPSGVR
ncbi:hypothetical protein KGM_214427 [Danaus plexippus plexippus]|uniref:Uncharacterized protein n=1 Tax=Danaus plexippus plexippus TaxID=278856 RepID=A0A212FGH9_DANPL|nr:hypothetical protein KGM_214427 [Danaus plexippus plexippus]